MRWYRTDVSRHCRGTSETGRQSVLQVLGKRYNTFNNARTAVCPVNDKQNCAALPVELSSNNRNDLSSPFDKRR